MSISTDAQHMQHALRLARHAESLGEVPVGALVVKNDAVIAEGWNRPISDHDPTAHAEIMALRAAAQQLQNYRLPGTTLYVTLEPCCMCAGAIVHARVARVVFAASDPKAGAAGSVLDLFTHAALNHHPSYEGGLMAEESAELLRAFFKARR